MTKESIGIAISEIYPDSLNPTNAVMLHDANVIGIITGVGPAKISNYNFKQIRRIAKAINMILVNNLDDCLTIFEKLEINELWMGDLISGIIIPKKKLVDNLVKHYKVNPSYLFYMSDKIWL